MTYVYLKGSPMANPKTPVWNLCGHTIDIDKLIADAINAQTASGMTPLAIARNFGGSYAGVNASVGADGVGTKLVTITSGWVDDDHTIAVATIMRQNGELVNADATIAVQKSDDAGAEYVVYTFEGGVAADADFTIVFYKIP